jgi:hypothetical protein
VIDQAGAGTVEADEEVTRELDGLGSVEVYGR